MEELTPEQVAGLRHLRYLAPLLIRLNITGPRYEMGWGAGQLTARDFDLNPPAPRGIIDFAQAAFTNVYPSNWTRVTHYGATFPAIGMIDFHPTTGVIVCSRSGRGTTTEATARYSLASWPPSEELRWLLPDDVAALFERTLRPSGIPGVLADWIDERTGTLARFTQTLRHGRRLYDDDRASGVTFRQFRYGLVTRNVAFWAANGTNRAMDDSPPQLPLIGIGLFGEHGLQKKWEFVLDREFVDDFGDVAAVWRDFPDPDALPDAGGETP